MCEGCRIAGERIAKLEATLENQNVMMKGLVAMTKKLFEDATGAPATVILALPDDDAEIVGMAERVPEGLAERLR